MLWSSMDYIFTIPYRKNHIAAFGILEGCMLIKTGHVLS